MPSHPFDFQIQTNIYATEELLALFDENRRFQRWLDIEAALAKTQGELGIIPSEAAAEIVSKANIEDMDLSLVRNEYQQSRNSLIPLLKGLRKACGNEYGEFVHYGATTQDILDTAQILELKDVFSIIYRDLRTLEEHLLKLTEQHKNTPMAARTHGQLAMPTTFGLKTAVWSVETRRHVERLKSLYPRVMAGQLSGAVGTMAAFGPQGMEVTRKTLAVLGLKQTSVSWHASRDNMAEIAAFFSILSGTSEKIANEVFQLGKNEINELHEMSPSKSTTSSTMPHKRNPVICQRIAVLARHVRSLTGVVLESMVHEHERDARALWSEWLAMPQIAIYSGTALSFLADVVADLEVLPENMMKNLHLQKETIASEGLLFHLSSKLGKMRAQERIHSVIQRAAAENLPFKQAVLADPELGPLMDSRALELLDYPEQYIGSALAMIENSLLSVRSQRQSDPEVLG